MVRVLWVVVGLLLASVAQAADIQYDLASGAVVGTGPSLSIPSVAGLGIVTIPEAVELILWPVPTGQPAATSCGTGKPEWTRITDPVAVTAAGAGMALLPGLKVFKTTSTLLPSCHAVASKRQLRALEDQAIATSAKAQDMVIVLAPINTWFLSLCMDVDAQGDLIWSTNANCTTWRTSLSTVNARYPSRAQGATQAADMAMLVNDVTTFLNTECTATPGGPFC